MTYFLKMPNRVLNLEPSSGTFSAAPFAGVAALDVSLEFMAEAVLEPGRAFSADMSAMCPRSCFPGKVEKALL
jgi:hypothetical protein